MFINPRIEFEKSILFRKKDCTIANFIFFKRDTDTRKRKTEGIPKKILTVDISRAEFPIHYSPSRPTHFSIVLVCIQQCANNTSHQQVIKVRDDIFLHPNQTTRDVPFNIPLAKGKIRSREFIFVGVDHDSNQIFPVDWKLQGEDYYSGFFKVLSRNTRGDGVQKQVDQGLSQMTSELWLNICKVASENITCDFDVISNHSFKESESKRRRFEPITISPTPLLTSTSTTTSFLTCTTSSPTSSSPSSSSDSSSPTSSSSNGNDIHPYFYLSQQEEQLVTSIMNDTRVCIDDYELNVPNALALLDNMEVLPIIDLNQYLFDDSTECHNHMASDYFVATSSATCAEFDFLLNAFNCNIQQNEIIESSSLRPSTTISVVDHSKFFFSALEC